MHRHDRHIFAKIIAKRRKLTVPYLELLLQIGNKEIYFEIMYLADHVREYLLSKRIRYAAQKSVMCRNIELVTRMVGDKPLIEQRPIAELNLSEVKRAVGKNGQIPIAVQIKAITNPPPKPAPKTTTETIPVRKKRFLGNFAVRQNAAGQFIFEPTKAIPYNLQHCQVERIEGKRNATIALWEWDK